ncbi:MAG TPA: hypothetical protein PLF00_05125 [Candidatus Marinimicrobia bacterium]|jgi:hypothetical protein|nr:hypothetical protein [Candidatus Neomarinimicrobiota bacterium]
MAENGKEEYIKELEETISEFLKPLKNIPFRIAIKAISGCDVIPFNKNNPNDKQLLKDLIAATRREGRRAFLPVHWKIFSIDNLIGQIKHEFNSSNKQMYKDENLLAEGGLE